MAPLEEIQDATRRLLRTVDDLPDDAYAAPSLLPGWSRGHVVAHLTLNAEALTGVLAGVALGRPVPMYASGEARDADIAELAAAPPAQLRTRLLGATTEFADAVAAVPQPGWGTEVERTPDGPTFTAGAVPGMREREVEIHHVDLDTTFAPSDWPSGFATRLLEAISRRQPARPFRVRATDLGHTWQCGGAAADDGPIVSGTAADLGWWLTGRGNGERLTSTGTNGEDDVLPRIEEW